MHQFFVEKSQVGKEYVTITGSDVNHIRNVLRMKIGEMIRISDREGGNYFCKIAETGENFVQADIVSVDEEGTELPSKIYLFQALPKGDRMETVIEKAVELGVYEITPIYTENSIIKIDSQKEEKKLIRWLKICKEASEQSFRDTIPIINKIQNIDDLKVNDLNLICSTREKSNYIKNVLKKASNCDKINVVIGPEGGLSPKEEDKFIKMGYLPITLGNRIMRVETVPLFILSIINYEFMR